PFVQERPVYGWSGLYQYLLSRGIGILAPNIRGSSGYGTKFERLIMRNFGGDDLRDVETAVDFARSLDWVDRDRLGIFGMSYGGFIALAAVSRLPELWRAAVSWAGPSDLLAWVEEGIPERRQWRLAALGDPDR